MADYITYKRFKGMAICGCVNIPAQSSCELDRGFIVYNSKRICSASSENAYRFFARDDDGYGMKRGYLTTSIQMQLSKSKHHQKRWDKVWSDPICQKYRRIEHADHWLWNHDFFNASIEDLMHIANLVGAKGGKNVSHN